MIMDNFDFAKVCRVMQYLDWRWGDGLVPTVERLQQVALGLLTDVRSQLEHHSNYQECTGGLLAIGYWSSGAPRLELQFVLCSLCSDY